ncbi:LuxR C-terminal-related transcriptional regulator [Pseudoclavibacter sp. 13-3]|uniref:LuxR C-terminal-related transcriptional regulator n=1 Tax=Pseudoclavibacter sp. 13-3 TaxID=2901228 RepID=UPI001E3C3A36|nr:LuxR C-terminal-related transcriptional regulator [Pseudoclavibacter sp. 13-3]
MTSSASTDSTRAPLIDAAELLALVDNDADLAKRVTHEAGRLQPVVDVMLGRGRAVGNVDDAALGVLTNLHLSEREVDFFSAMALPVALTHSLAVELWPDSDFSDLLDGMMANGLISRADDDVTVIGRVPEALRRVVRQECRRRRPDTYRQNMQRVREAMKKTEQPPAARLQQAFEDQDVTSMIEVLRPNLYSLTSEVPHLMHRALRALPPEVQTSHPDLMFCRAFLAAQAKVPVTDSTKVGALELEECTRSPSRELRLLSSILILRLRQSYAESDRAAEPLRTSTIAVSRLHTGLSALLAGRYATAARDFEATLQIATRDGDRMLCRDAESKLAVTRVLMGDIVAADRHLRHLRTLPKPTGRIREMVCCGEYTAALFIAAERLDRAEAERLIGLTQAAAYWHDELWPFLLLAYRRAVQVLGVPSLLTAILEEIRPMVPAADEMPAQIVTICQVETMISARHLGAAHTLAGRLSTLATPIALPTRARLALYAGDFLGASDLSGKALSFDSLGPLARAEAMTLAACAAWHTGRSAEAQSMLREAAAIADLQGGRRSLAVVPGNLMAPLYAACEIAAPHSLVPDVLPRPKLPPTLLHLVQLISQGRSNSEIANELHVSTNTVKSNIQRLYRALDVHNRKELLAVAAERGLLR